MLEIHAPGKTCTDWAIVIVCDCHACGATMADHPPADVLAPVASLRALQMFQTAGWVRGKVVPIQRLVNRYKPGSDELLGQETINHQTIGDRCPDCHKRLTQGE